MTEIKTQILKDNPHTIHATVSFWTRHLNVTVDDKPSSSNKGIWKWKKTATIYVGDKEKHRVDVNMEGFLPKLKVQVDNELIASS
jgi:hypothetical protein